MQEGVQLLVSLMIHFFLVRQKKRRIADEKGYLALVQQRVCPSAWQVDEAVSEREEGDGDGLEHGE